VKCTECDFEAEILVSLPGDIAACGGCLAYAVRLARVVRDATSVTPQKRVVSAWTERLPEFFSSELGMRLINCLEANGIRCDADLLSVGRDVVDIRGVGSCSALLIANYLKGKGHQAPWADEF
jgi:hypothetical protein